MSKLFGLPKACFLLRPTSSNTVQLACWMGLPTSSSRLAGRRGRFRSASDFLLDDVIQHRPALAWLRPSSFGNMAATGSYGCVRRRICVIKNVTSASRPTMPVAKWIRFYRWPVSNNPASCGAVAGKKCASVAHGWCYEEQVVWCAVFSFYIKCLIRTSCLSINTVYRT